MQYKRGYLNYYVDVSGGPKEKTIFGCVGIKNTDVGKLVKEFRREFPKSSSKEHKSARLDENELCQIIDFLNSKDVCMTALRFENTDWRYYGKRFSEVKKHFYSRMYGLLYAKVLKERSLQHHIYSIVLCNEDYLSNKELAKNICLEVTRLDGYEFYISHSDNKTYFPLKFADYVAGGLRKLGKARMQEYKHFRLIDKSIPKIYLIKAFGRYVN